MCGIAGIVNLKGNSSEIITRLKTMSHTLRHRGMDDEGFVFFNENNFVVAASNDTQPESINFNLNYCPQKNIDELNAEFKFGFAHRRLSIIDLSPTGHQPLCTIEENLWITFNGEVYNYIEIKKELQSLGHSFRTSTDTEVVLLAYKQWGKQCLHKFNGMWSFVIYDKTKNILFGARDRFGVKPFYYYKDENQFCFASEQKAMIKNSGVSSGINDAAVYDFFVNSELEYKTESFFKNIIELFPSHSFEFDLKTNDLKIERYYELKSPSDYKVYSQHEEKKVIEEIQELVYNSIKLRLRSDVEVGTCLSGGIDSSVIAGTMNLLQAGKKTNFYTAVFPNSSIDESKWAQKVVDNSNCNWHKIEPAASDLFNDLESLIYCQDIPIWSTSTYAQFRVMKKVNETGVKVVLDGQGGDELFSGYLPYFRWYWNDLSKFDKTELNKSLKAFGLTDAMKFWAKETLKVKFKTGERFSFKSDEKDILNKAFQNEYKAAYRHETNAKDLNHFLVEEFTNTRLKTYLKCEDRCAMHWGVESRTPFADDINLIEKVFSLPFNLKMKNATTKYLLREASKAVLPNEIYKRKDKMGYVTPNDFWLSQNHEKIKEIIEIIPSHYISKEIFSSKTNHLFAKTNHLQKSFTAKESVYIFKTIAFATWLRLNKY